MENEKLIFDSFLKTCPGFAGEPIKERDVVDEWYVNRGLTPPAAPFDRRPDVICISESGRKIGVELKSWLNEEQIAEARARERIEENILGAIGEQPPNETQHIGFIWLSAKEKRFDVQDAEQFREQMFSLIERVDLYAGTGGRTTTPQGYSGDSVRQKFTQKERDSETGLDYYNSRYFGSSQGRFTSADSVAGSRWDPQSLNRYSYVGNNPLKFSDPSGHMRELTPLQFNPWAFGLKDKAKELRWTVQGQSKKQLPPTEGGPLGVPIEHPCIAAPCASPIYLGTVTVVSSEEELTPLENFTREMYMRAVPMKEIVETGAKIDVAIILLPLALEGGAVDSLGLESAATESETVTLLPQFSNSTLDEAVESVMSDPNKLNHIF